MQLLFVADAVDAGFGGKIDAAIGHRRRAEDFGGPAVGHCDHFAVDGFGGLVAGGDDGDTAVDLGGVDVAVRENGRTLTDCADIVDPLHLAGPSVEGVHIRRVVDDVKQVVVNDGAAIAGEDPIIAPDLVGGGDIAGAGGVDANDATQCGVVEVFLAVSGVDFVVGDDN